MEVSCGFMHGERVQGLMPSCTTFQIPVAQSLFPCHHFLTSLALAMLLVRSRELREGVGLPPGCIGDISDSPALVWAVGGQQLPWFPAWGRGMGLSGQPHSLNPKASPLPSYQNLLHSWSSLAGTWGISLVNPTCQGFGVQKHAAFPCASLLKTTPFCNPPCSRRRWESMFLPSKHDPSFWH